MGDNFVRLAHNGGEFLRAETQAGNTFADIALRSDDPASIRRNRVHARSAYDTVIRYRERALVAAQDAHEINQRLALLKSKLQQLGES